MSLPNYLANIKSSGLYRFVNDKSQIPAQVAETLRLVVGYSEKGPFNTPVYIDNKADFINTFGNISKRLEKKGVFFHRMALQALAAGPILALNIKPFRENPSVPEVVTAAEADAEPSVGGDIESIGACTLNFAETEYTAAPINVIDLYDRDRFWKIDVDKLPTKFDDNKYVNMAITDNVNSSCSIFIKPVKPKEYNISIGDYYRQVMVEDLPDYLMGNADDKMNDYFAEIYVFKGKFTSAICGEHGTLGKYFTATGGDETIALNDKFTSTIYNDDVLAALVADPNSNFIGKYVGCTLPFMKDGNGNYNSLDIVFNTDTASHKMIMKFDEDKLNDINVDSKAKNTALEDLLFPVSYYVGDANRNEVKKNIALKPLYFEGYTYGSILSFTTVGIQTAVFDEMEKPGLYNALTNNVDVNYHYIIDTFESIPTQSPLKGTLAGIAKAKGNALAICNFPSVADIHAATYAIDDNLSTNIVLPTEVEGASFVAYYTPLVFGDRAVKVTVPSAAVVSNNFMEKYNSRQPYYIVAGPNYGRISAGGLIGPDYNYSKKDLDILEPMGVNAIIYVPRKGTFINSNQTAKQTPVSALSKVHVRELVIYLQDEIENMMQNYQWELNTQTLRDTIKAKADTILENVKNNGGIYDYLNICDGSNNTPEVIDKEMIILDTAIEPARGAGKMVQQLTIHKTGGISALTK